MASGASKPRLTAKIARDILISFERRAIFARNI
jgi:hypothetical protein